MAAGLSLLPLQSLPAQTGAAGSVRVIATYDPGAEETTFELAEPLHGRELLAIQRALEAAGFPPGALDGRIGEATRSALDAFQGDRGLRRCGCPTYETAMALGLTPRVIQTIVGRGTPRPDFSVEVIYPAGVPPEAPPGPAGAGGGAEAGAPEAAVGTSPAAPPAWPGAAAPGLFIPIFPLSAPFVDPMAPRPAAEPPSGAPLGRIRGRGLGTSPRVRPAPPPRARPAPPAPGRRPSGPPSPETAAPRR